MTDPTRRSPEGEQGSGPFDTGRVEHSPLGTSDSTQLGISEEWARRRAESERAAAELSAKIQKQEMKQAKDRAFDKKPDTPGFWKRSRDLSKSTKKTASVTGIGTALVGVGIFELLAKIPKAIGYKMSDIVTGIESWGQNTLSKHKWIKFIPFFGPWLLKKPEKTWRERDAEEEKKKKKKKESTKVEKDAEKELVDSGLTKKQAKALLKVKKDDKEKKDDKDDKEKKDDKDDKEKKDD